MSPIGGKIRPIHRPDAAARRQFAHSYKAPIRDIHGTIRIFFDQGKHLRQFLCQNKIGIKDNISS